MDAKISNSDEMKNVLQVKSIPTGIALSILIRFVRLDIIP